MTQPMEPDARSIAMRVPTLRPDPVNLAMFGAKLMGEIAGIKLYESKYMPPGADGLFVDPAYPENALWIKMENKQ